MNWTIPESNIITIEDPVEYQKLEGINQVQSIHKNWADLCSRLAFPSLTSRPERQNIIMWEKIRDRETALENSVRAALTVHLVFSTLHTQQWHWKTILRLLDMGNRVLILICLGYKWVVVAQNRLVKTQFAKIVLNTRKATPIEKEICCKRGIKHRPQINVRQGLVTLAVTIPVSWTNGYHDWLWLQKKSRQTDDESNVIQKKSNSHIKNKVFRFWLTMDCWKWKQERTTLERKKFLTSCF